MVQNVPMRLQRQKRTNSTKISSWATQKKRSKNVNSGSQNIHQFFIPQHTHSTHTTFIWCVHHFFPTTFSLSFHLLQCMMYVYVSRIELHVSHFIWLVREHTILPTIVRFVAWQMSFSTCLRLSLSVWVSVAVFHSQSLCNFVRFSALNVNNRNKYQRRWLRRGGSKWTYRLRLCYAFAYVRFLFIHTSIYICVCVRACLSECLCFC